jgi:hypothetical protein
VSSARSRDLHTIARLVLVLALSVGAGLAYHRCRATPEQEDLTRLVERELPSVLATDGEIQARLEALLAAPSTRAEEARHIIVDELMPKIAKLRQGASALGTQTQVVQRLKVGYLEALDRLAEACRTIVRTIDDPKLTSAEALARVRAEITQVRATYDRWNADVTRTCAEHRLAGPRGRAIKK